MLLIHLLRGLKVYKDLLISINDILSIFLINLLGLKVYKDLLISINDILSKFFDQSIRLKSI